MYGSLAVLCDGSSGGCGVVGNNKRMTLVRTRQQTGRSSRLPDDGIQPHSEILNVEGKRPFNPRTIARK